MRLMRPPRPPAPPPARGAAWLTAATRVAHATSTSGERPLICHIRIRITCAGVAAPARRGRSAHHALWCTHISAIPPRPQGLWASAGPSASGPRALAPAYTKRSAAQVTELAASPSARFLKPPLNLLLRGQSRQAGSTASQARRLCAEARRARHRGGSAQPA